MAKSKKKSFEFHYDEIEKLVERIRPQWTLHAVQHVSFDDVKQIILLHIFVKWEQYDPKRPLANWVSRIVGNQFINQLRNLYLSTQRPCSKCASNIGGDQCSLYGTQCEECPLYNTWKKTKFIHHQARLPLPIENHAKEVYARTDSDFDYTKAAEALHRNMKKILKPNHWTVYKALYIQYKSDDEVAKMMGFRTSEAGRKRGYRRMIQLKKEIIEKVKDVLLNDKGDEDIFC